jgi:sulfite exporter TauE/SafE
MRRVTAMIAAVLFVGLGVLGCERGPMQKAGEKIDKITDQDKVIGKGPVEKAGKEVDKTVRDIKR